MYTRSASRDQLATEVQFVLQIIESERISFGKECIVPTMKLTDSEQKNTMLASERKNRLI